MQSQVLDSDWGPLSSLSRQFWHNRGSHQGTLGCTWVHSGCTWGARKVHSGCIRVHWGAKVQTSSAPQCTQVPPSRIWWWPFFDLVLSYFRLVVKRKKVKFKHPHQIKSLSRRAELIIQISRSRLACRSCILQKLPLRKYFRELVTSSMTSAAKAGGCKMASRTFFTYLMMAFARNRILKVDEWNSGSFN